MTRKPNGYWPNLENIEREARELIEKHNLEKIPSGIELTKMGESGLSGAISNHYPGGFIGLRKALGEEGIIKSKGYWPNPENIERETGEFMEKHEFDILPNRTKLAEMGESALGSAISKHYPGGFRALRKALGEERIIKSKGYWPNQENIERETREFMEKHEFDILPSENTLGEMGRLDLGNSISRHYPGGFRGLRAALGEERIMKPKGYWPNPENIEREARELIEEHNLERIPSLHKLGEMGRSDIGNAIVTHYPGGFGALRKALGEEKIPKNFNKDLRKLYAQHKQLLEETKGKKRKGKLHYLVGFGKSFENYVGILLALENSEVEHQFKIETKNSFRIIDFVQNSQSYISLEDAIDDLIEVKSGRTLNSHDKSQLEDFLEQGEEITYVVHDRESQLAKSIQIIAEERGIKINIVTPQELETFSRVEGTNL